MSTFIVRTATCNHTTRTTPTKTITHNSKCSPVTCQPTTITKYDNGWQPSKLSVINQITIKCCNFRLLITVDNVVATLYIQQTGSDKTYRSNYMDEVYD